MTNLGLFNVKLEIDDQLLGTISRYCINFQREYNLLVLCFNKNF